MKQLYFLLVAIFFCSQSCEKQKTERPFGTLIEVPNEVISIQEAINIAQPHDTILLQPQEYFEHSININKPLYITSLFLNLNDSGIIDRTIINASDEGRVISICEVTDTVRLNGFTIKNGRGTHHWNNGDMYDDYYGGGIYCKESNLKVSNVIIKDNAVSYPSYWGTGGGMFIKKSYIELNNVMLFNNFALGSSGGFDCDSSIVVIKNSQFYENTTKIGGPVISISSSNIKIYNSLFKNNNTAPDYIHELLFYNNIGYLNKVTTINDTLKMGGNNNLNIIDCNIQGIDY